MGTLFQLMITIGIFLIAMTNVFIARPFVNPATSLPLMFLTVTLFAALMFRQLHPSREPALADA